ncbi:unnamed protein product, partial [marine sediment metagenome]
DAAAEAVKNDLRDIFNMAGYSYYLRLNVLNQARSAGCRLDSFILLTMALPIDTHRSAS